MKTYLPYFLFIRALNSVKVAKSSHMKHLFTKMIECVAATSVLYYSESFSSTLSSTLWPKWKVLWKVDVDFGNVIDGM